MFKRLKELILSESVCEWLNEHNLYAYTYLDNWHKQPFISKLMCRLGRHDFEFENVLLDVDGNIEGGCLECFYCERGRHSYHSLGTTKN